MELLYIAEPISCYHYANDGQAGFKYLEISQKAFLSNEIAQFHYLVFVLKGKLEFSCEHFDTRTINAGEFFFISKNMCCSSCALEDSRIIIHKYAHIVHLCGKSTLMDLNKYAQKEYFFAPLSICLTLNMFLDLMLVYLKSGGNCIHLHTIKQEELFWILRVNYEKETLANLFHSIIGNSLNFRNKVFDFYKLAGTAQELTKLCGYSRQQFNKLFLNEFGVPPYTWMQKQVMIHIKSRLADKDIKLNEIVDEFNLSSLSHLTRLCKKHFEKTPLALRNEIISKQEESYISKIRS